MSAMLFAIILGPIIRMLKLHASMPNPVRAYTDDIVLVFHELWNHGFAVAACFALIVDGTGLKLNTRKSIIIPLWRYRTKLLHHLVN